MFHAGLLGCGWIGVQIFFVLSGYLISRQLVEQRDAPLGAYLKWFYGRRALRIFPLYFACLAGMQTVSWAGINMHGVREGLPYAWVYLYNIYHAKAGFLHSQVITHFWSLCVEEQFYLVWPFVLFFCPPQRLRAVLLAIVMSGPLVRFGMWLSFRAHPELFIDPPEVAVYVLTPSHLDAFGLGALTALYPPRHSRSKLALVGAALVVSCLLVSQFATFDHRWFPNELGMPVGLAPGYAFIWMYSLLNLFSAFLIDALAHHGFAARVFDSRVLSYIGKISYGIYILHFPLQTLLYRLLPPPTYGLAVRIPVHLAITIAAASLSYRFLESPWLAWKGRLFPTPSRAVPVHAAPRIDEQRG